MTAMLPGRPGETRPNEPRSRSGSCCFGRQRARSISAGSTLGRAAPDTSGSHRGSRSWLVLKCMRHGGKPVELSSEEPVEELPRRLEPKLALGRRGSALP
jgi:hypothetical protein